MEDILSWELALESFSTSLIAKHLPDKKRNEYISTLRDLKAFVFANFDLEHPFQITSYHLRRYMKEFADDDSSRELITKKKRALCSFFGFHSKRGNFTDNPSLDLITIRERRRPARLPLRPQANEGILARLAMNGPTLAEPEQSVVTEIEDKPVTAQIIKAHLDTMVVGQETAKVQISVLFSMHMNWFKHQERMHRSPNAILIGPTGVGKTHTIRIASEFLKIPFVTVDTTTVVPSGIAGLQVEDILGDLVREANDILERTGRKRSKDDDIELARRGIIFFDEFDKINIGGKSRGYQESSNLSVQRSLLKLTDGSKKGIGVRGHITADRPRTIDTSGILVLAGGAFVGIDTNEIRTLRPVELQRDLARSNNMNTLVSADIVSYGFMPELVARLPVIVEYRQLDESDLLSILNNVDVSPIQTWIDHFEMMEKQLIISDEAKLYATKKAVILKMGARGLQQILFPTLARLAYKIESSAENVYTVSVDDLDAKLSSKMNGE